MNNLNPSSVNTTRMVSVMNEANEVTVLTTFARIGNGKCVDNFNSGGDDVYRYSLNQWMNLVEETFEVKGINKYYSYYNSGYEIKTNVMIVESATKSLLPKNFFIF